MTDNHTHPVSVTTGRMVLPTYPALDPDPNPMFFDTRDVQRAKGNIYPVPFTDQLSNEKVDREYDALTLENDYIQVIVLPELGGRIFAALDKTNNYDFFYRHKVIKPALIGLFGPWISGGIEFNWPQHHRPSTFMPQSWSIETGEDGSQTVWMGEHDPLNRTKGMVGVCLHPGKAIVETKVRLYNRTPFPQTFLWWANAGVKIDERYQVIFPPDVHYTQFHTKEFVMTYPKGAGQFAGNNYPPDTDVSFWANSPQATSFFAAESKYEFFGGYDHNMQAGVVHVANRHISPGKKFFTWGNGPFGHRWQRNLMDDTGEYLELMAGVYTDNQPDFSWIMPYETRTFSQFWFPVQQIGPMKNANQRAALNLETTDGVTQVGVYTTEVIPNAAITLSAAGQTVYQGSASLAPGSAFIKEIRLPEDISPLDLRLDVQDADGREVISYTTEQPFTGEIPAPYQPPAPPEQVDSIEDLYLIGLHLDQYRHPFWAPEVYWQAALRRDPADSRCSVAMGKLHLRRGQFEKAEACFRTAVKRLTSRNLNPYDGEAHYMLGMALFYQARLDEAYDALYKSTWNRAWQSPAFFQLALIDCRQGKLSQALGHLDAALQADARHSSARNLKAAILRRMGNGHLALPLIEETLSTDPLDYRASWERVLLADPLEKNEQVEAFRALSLADPQVYLDVAFEYMAAGFYADAAGVLEAAVESGPLYPVVGYALGSCALLLGDEETAQQWYARAALASPDYCFPSRLEEMVLLGEVLERNPGDARARYYLGNLLYDKHQYREGITLWREATRIQPGFSIPWRNLGLAAYNLRKDMDAALRFMQKALEANPADPRLLLELDQLMKRSACAPEDRLALFEQHADLVRMRDDLSVELAALHNRLGQFESAYEILTSRTFHAFEGGEGSASGQYTLTCLLLGRRALETGDAAQALDHFQAGIDYPESLGEVPGPVELAALHLYSGLAREQMGELEEARACFERVLAMPAWFSPARYYRAVAQAHLDCAEEAEETLTTLLAQAQEELEKEIEQPFFYQPMPSPVFVDDLSKLKEIYCRSLAGLAHLGLGDPAAAKTAFQRVLELDPAHTLVWEEFRRIR